MGDENSQNSQNQNQGQNQGQDQNQGQQGQQGQQQDQNQNQEAKFTQEDLNKLLQERLASEKTKHQKELDDLKTKLERDAELSKLSENDRIKAELEDSKAKIQKYEDEIALNSQTAETRKLLNEAKIPESFLKFVLVPKDENQTKVNIQELKTVFEAEIKKGVEAQIKPHNPHSNPATVERKNNNVSGPTYSGFNLQNSLQEYYKDKL